MNTHRRPRCRPRRVCFEQLESRALLAADGLNAGSSLTHALNATPPSAKVILSTTDLAGVPISTIPAGQDFKLQAQVQDLRTKSNGIGFGVFAEYINVAFSSVLASIPGSLMFDAAFSNGQHPKPPNLASTTAGSIVEAGAFNNSTDPVSLTALPAAQILWTVTVHAVAGGAETFHPSQPITPSRAMDVYGDGSSIPANQIQFVDASIQITDTPTISISSVSNPETDSGTTPFIFTVSLSSSAAAAVTVAYATADGTATIANNDYVATAGTLTFAAGTTTQTVTIAVNGDTVVEPDETFAVNLSNASTNATVGQSVGTGTIINDDLVPISIVGVSQPETDSGTTDFVFTATLGTAVGSTVTVAYATADGTATVANNDYVATSGTLTFAAGTTTQTITVAVNGDTAIEPDETFSVALSTPSANALISPSGTALGTILNDDFPSLSIAGVSQAEGDSGTTSFVFTVTLSSSVGAAVTVRYATADGTATLANNDYQVASGTLTFAPGTTVETITVAVNGDSAIEPDETFAVNLSNPSPNATISTAQAIGKILNDDTSISINDVAKLEGNSGTTNFVFNVAEQGAGAQTVTVAYATADGTATVADSDYTAASGTLTFSAGITSLLVTIAVSGDAKTETDETFSVALANPTNAVLLKAQGTGTIANDDGLPFPYQNPRLQWDVNADGNVFALDALIVINQLNSNGLGPLSPPTPTDPRVYVDVSGDGSLTPLDAILVINYLNQAATPAVSSGLRIAAIQSGPAPATAAPLSGTALNGPAVNAGATPATNAVVPAQPLLADQAPAHSTQPAKHERDLEGTLDALLGFR